MLPPVLYRRNFRAAITEPGGSSTCELTHQRAPDGGDAW
jgi:hypothetical protein